jgi:plasmid stability protein
MAVSFSIKDVPDDLAEELRARAARNHRSIQGELRHILESAVRPRPFQATTVFDRIRALGFSTEADSVETVRRLRDDR